MLIEVVEHKQTMYLVMKVYADTLTHFMTNGLNTYKNVT